LLAATGTAICVVHKPVAGFGVAVDRRRASSEAGKPRQEGQIFSNANRPMLFWVAGAFGQSGRPIWAIRRRARGLRARLDGGAGRVDAES